MQLFGTIVWFINKNINRSQSYIPCRKYRALPFVDLYRSVTGDYIPKHILDRIKRKHPNIENLSQEQLQYSLKILEKFNITALDSCENVRLLCMDPITVDNYAKILKECGFIEILPKYILRYHTFVRQKTISWLKDNKIIIQDLNPGKNILDNIQDWPKKDKEKVFQNFHEDQTTLLKLRLSILSRYLEWKLSITSVEFEKYCRNYKPFKHKPVTDIQETLDIAQNNIKFNLDVIKRNGFILSYDPLHIKQILDNVPQLVGLDIREALRIEPSIMKNNYKSIIKIRDLLEEYRIPLEIQRRHLRLYCMHPDTIQERLNELKNLKEYQVLSTNPRAILMVIYHKKVLKRLSRIREINKQCYSLNLLLSSKKVFNRYINSHSSKMCGSDIGILICSSLLPNDENFDLPKYSRITLNQLKRHKYFLHSSFDIIDGNIKYLKSKFNNDDIYYNCILLLYPSSEVEYYIEMFLQMRHSRNFKIKLDTNYSNIDFTVLTDHHLLSLAQYEIEKKYYFSGDGIWTGQENLKREQLN